MNVQNFPCSTASKERNALLNPLACQHYPIVVTHKSQLLGHGKYIFPSAVLLVDINIQLSFQPCFVCLIGR